MLDTLIDMNNQKLMFNNSIFFYLSFLKESFFFNFLIFKNSIKRHVTELNINMIVIPNMRIYNHI